MSGQQNETALLKQLMTQNPSSPSSLAMQRLKTLKRAMYGRVSVEIMRARLLPLPHF
jgi:hypothetical protein